MDSNDVLISNTYNAKILISEGGISVVKEYNFPEGNIWYYKYPITDPRRPENVEIKIYELLNTIKNSELLICPKLISKDEKSITIEYADLGSFDEYLETIEDEDFVESEFWAIVLLTLLNVCYIKKKFPTFIHGTLVPKHILLFERPVSFDITIDNFKFDLSVYETNVAIADFSTAQILPEIQNTKREYFDEGADVPDTDLHEFLSSLLEYVVIPKKCRSKIRKLIEECKTFNDVFSANIFDEYRI